MSVYQRVCSWTMAFRRLRCFVDIGGWVGAGHVLTFMWTCWWRHATLWLPAGACIHSWVGHLLTFMWVCWWRTCYSLWLPAGACIHGWGGVGWGMFMWSCWWRTCYSCGCYCKFSRTFHSCVMLRYCKFSLEHKDCGTFHFAPFSDTIMCSCGAGVLA